MANPFAEPPPINAARGEVALQIGDVHLAIAVTFSGLSQVSRMVSAATMAALYDRLLGFEPWVVACALPVFSVADGDEEEAKARAFAALKVLSAADEMAWREAMEVALAHHLEEGQRLRQPPPDLSEQVEEAMAGNGEKKPEAATP